MATRNQNVQTVENATADQAVDSQALENINQAILEVNQILIPIGTDPATLDLTQKNHHTRIIQYVDSFGYRIDSTSLDDYFVLIIGTTVDSDLAVNTMFFDNGYVLLGDLSGIYKQVGDIKAGDFRCLPQYKTLLSSKVQKFCSTQIKRLTANKAKAEENKKTNKAKRDALLAQLMA